MHRKDDIVLILVPSVEGVVVLFVELYGINRMFDTITDGFAVYAKDIIIKLKNSSSSTTANYLSRVGMDLPWRNVVRRP